ncbi:MAG: hypothetical protein B7Z29_04220 [Hyphomicrobium sp. 12-62-95]|nr:MAG: hypothetical protein B7Z29_04220 [Hyphomicrobium sp. 12-62-95]
MVALPSAADTPPALADLPGVKGRDGESELLARGYTFHHGAEAKDGKITVWWNAATQSCVEVLTQDGRYATVTTAPVKECEGDPR